jgi:hypothetical protein
MSIFKGILNILSPKAKSPKRAASHRTAKLSHDSSDYDFRLIGSKGDGIKLAGTSTFQTELKRAAGKFGEQGVNKTVRVNMVEDDRNQHDTNAVKVMIDGVTIAYLPAARATEYREQVKAAGLSGKVGEASARIVGGFITDEGIAHLGARLLCEWPLKLQNKKL